MTIGDGIFWGAFVIAGVALFATTKDRWNWRRITKWAFALPAVLLVFGGVGIWAVETYSNRAKPQNEFGGVSLAASRNDVRFAKGQPSEVLEDGNWLYYAGSGSARPESAGYVVSFQNEKVRYVSYGATPDQIVTPDIHGLSIGASYARVLEVLGPPDEVSSSEDGLKRIISYPKLNTFYSLERAEVQTLGLYDPTAGPLRFKGSDGATSSESSGQTLSPKKN